MENDTNLCFKTDFLYLYLALYITKSLKIKWINNKIFLNFLTRLKTRIDKLYPKKKDYHKSQDYNVTIYQNNWYTSISNSIFRKTINAPCFPVFTKKKGLIYTQKKINWWNQSTSCEIKIRIFPLIM